MIEITSTTEFKEKILEAKEPVLVDFNADWCGPCQMMKPILEELTAEHQIASVNIDNLGELAAEYQVMSIPCMVLFKDGKEVERVIGARPKSDIEKLLEA